MNLVILAFHCRVCQFDITCMIEMLYVGNTELCTRKLHIGTAVGTCRFHRVSHVPREDNMNLSFTRKGVWRFDTMCSISSLLTSMEYMYLMWYLTQLR